ncbi:MAG: aminopeptidase P N-terminal domain-containing protein [Candidatus Hodarchaeales archaeon]|jgi:Xaa-Pro aminopeptidase
MQIKDLELEVYQKRRDAVIKDMKDNSVLVIPPNPSSKRSYDTENKYKANSDLIYLSGYQEEEASLILTKGETKSFHLSVLPRDQEKETWTGKRFGPEGAKNLFRAEEAYSTKELDEKLHELFKNSYSIYYRFGINSKYDAKVLNAYKKASMNIPRNFVGPREIIDSNQIIHEMRLFKDELEIEYLTKSCEIASLGHLEGMKHIKPGMYEYQIQSIVEHVFLKNGGLHPAYPSICGSGENATILHYMANVDQFKDGDLFLIDAGTEYNNYCSDITRTYPVNGKFTKVQAKVYNIVLNAQNKAIEACEPENSFSSVHDEAVRVLTEGMITIGALEGNIEEIIKEEKYKKFFMHGTSHWLGLNTHDAGIRSYLENEKDLTNVSSRKLQPGMVLTVEPGLYFQPHIEDIPEELKGIGVRIEDDILITQNGYKNLTEKAPRSIEDMEKIIGSA